MLGAILKATNSSFQKGMKLLAFMFEQPSYTPLELMRIDRSLVY